MAGAAALGAVNPMVVLFQPKICPPCTLPILTMVMIIGWWRRERSEGSLVWGLVGASLGQIQIAGFFLRRGTCAMDCSLSALDRALASMVRWLHAPRSAADALDFVSASRILAAQLFFLGGCLMCSSSVSSPAGSASRSVWG